MIMFLYKADLSSCRSFFYAMALTITFFSRVTAFTTVRYSKPVALLP